MNRTDVLIFGAAFSMLFSVIIMFFPEIREIGELGLLLAFTLVFIEFLCQKRES